MSEHTARHGSGERGQPRQQRRPRMRLRVRLRDMRIRTKLALILIAPLAAITVLAGGSLRESAEQATQAQVLQSLVAVSAASSTVVHELHGERIAAAALLDEPAGVERYSAASGRVDAAVVVYRDALAGLTAPPAAAAEQLDTIEVRLGELETIRTQLTGDDDVQVSVTGSLLRYGTITAALHAFTAGLAEVVDDPGLAGQVRAVASLSAAKLHAADAEALATLPARAGADAAASARAAQAGAFAEFERAATAGQREIADIITGSASQPAMRLAADRLHADLLAAVAQRRGEVNQQVRIEAAAVGIALLVTIATALFLASSLARSLRRLQSNAIQVAQHELPAAVATLVDPAALAGTTPQQLAGQIRLPTRLDGRDEIGQVAAALLSVQQVAVRTAAEQALLRTSVAAMFLNLARRSQTLVDKIISQLDTMQRGEHDPERLAAMFALDNLATRMRRNDENLLVLAGADTSPPREADALVADVLRAAQSEIEHYSRVEFGSVDDDVLVRAPAINDVVRLLAELLDNATRYSPPGVAVVCEARRLGDTLIINVEDRGVGMSGEHAEAVNAWLAEPATLDVSAIRHMGIAVVGRLAARHRIQTQLNTHPHHGTTAVVTLPRDLLVLPMSRQILTTPALREPPAGIATSAPVPLPRRSAEVIRHGPGRRPNRPPYGTTSEPAHGRSSTASQQIGPPTVEPLPASHMPVAGRPATLADHTPPTMELPIFAETWFSSHRSEHHTTARRPSPPDAIDWRSPADHGWAAAAAAAQPHQRDATGSGLPKRVPHAQLVPGSVQRTSAPAQRRSPDEIRGLLSAYHRGIQRGRENPHVNHRQDG